MAKIQYDRLNVLNEVTNLFWKSGYYATSMQVIFDVTGLKSGSVYLSFGNKESLFKMTIEHYTNNSLTALAQLYNEKASVGESLCCFLKMFFDNSYKDDFNGCFLVKSQLELGDNKTLSSFVSERLARLEHFHFKQLLTLYEEDEAKEKAASIMLHLYGICIYGYNCENQDTLLNALHSGLPWLPWHKLH